MTETRIPANVSQQYLMDNEAYQSTASTSSLETRQESRDKKMKSDNGSSLSSVTAKEFIAVFVLCFVNLINYMDRFTVAGVLFIYYVYLYYIKII